MTRSLVVNVFTLALALVALVTVIGVATLWPSDRTVERPEGFVVQKTESAEVLAVRRVRCTTPGARFCIRLRIQLESGPKQGTVTSLGFAGRDVRFAVGDELRVYEQRLPEGAQIGGMALDPYQFSDFERKRPLVILAVLFAALVVATARFKGLRALVGPPQACS